MEQIDIGERHRARTQRHKKIVDSKIAAATDKRGVVLVLTGNGKGKSSSAFGMVARALGHGMRVGVVQFIKCASSTGEEVFFRRFPEVEFHVLGAGFTGRPRNLQQDIAAALEGVGEGQRFQPIRLGLEHSRCQSCDSSLLPRRLAWLATHELHPNPRRVSQCRPKWLRHRAVSRAYRRTRR